MYFSLSTVIPFVTHIEGEMYVNTSRQRYGGNVIMTPEIALFSGLSHLNTDKKILFKHEQNML